MNPKHQSFELVCADCAQINLVDARVCARCGGNLLRRAVVPAGINLADYIGQRDGIVGLRAFAGLYERRNQSIGHVLLVGNGGCGKRTLGRALAREYSLPAAETDGADLKKPLDVAIALQELVTNGLWIVSNVNKVSGGAQQAFATALREFKLASRHPYTIPGVPHQRRSQYELRPPFTCVATVTDQLRPSDDLRKLFELTFTFVDYSKPELHRLARALAQREGFTIEHPAADAVAAANIASPAEVARLINHLGLLGKSRVDLKAAADVLQAFNLPAEESGPPRAVTGLLRLLPTDFEKCVAGLLRRLGFQVELTKASGDGGVDIVAFSKAPITGGRYLVQCKRFAPRAPVGSPLVREFYGALQADRRAMKGILITTSYFTADAKRFAEGLPLELIDGERLAEIMEPGA